MNIPQLRTERYFLAPGINTIQKQYENTKEELIKHYKNQNTYKADTDESIMLQIDNAMKDMYGQLELSDRLSVKVNYFAVVEAEIYYLDKSIGNITFEFTIYSPWDSLKNAINQVNEFMKYRCVSDDKWEILEVQRLSSIDSNHL